ncbi:hypothetical protein BUV99_10760 [Corynebacterium diphtheriae]|nr:hypothetical protein BUV99_10760 [Corynebacterium diphtheriae]
MVGAPPPSTPEKDGTSHNLLKRTGLKAIGVSLVEKSFEIPPFRGVSGLECIDGLDGLGFDNGNYHRVLRCGRW